MLLIRGAGEVAHSYRCYSLPGIQVGRWQLRLQVWQNSQSSGKRKRSINFWYMFLFWHPPFCILLL